MEYKKIKVETYIPENYLHQLMDALNDINALTIGNYNSCLSTTKVIGYWRPLEGSNPFDGKLLELSKEEELKVEFKSDAELIDDIIKVIRRVHPYEEPVINIFPVIL